MKILVDKIAVRAGRRDTEPEVIQKLSESMTVLGLLNPVAVSADHTLIAGLHRLEAAKSLGWTEIECNVCDLEGSQMELAEIDENYVRTNLTALERADLMKRRKKLYETLYPETKAGISQAAGMNRAKGNHVSRTVRSTTKSFLDDTAEKFGLSRSTVARMVQIGENLTSAANEILKNTNVSQRTLLEISRMTPDQQEEVSTLLVEGKIKSISEYQASQQDAPREHNSDVSGFLTSFDIIVTNIRKQLETLNTPENQAAMSFVKPENFTEMEEKADAIYAALMDFIEQVKRAMPKN